MDNLYFQNFIFSGTKGTGVNVKDLFVSMLDQCGVPHDCTLIGDCTVIDSPIANKKIYTISQVDNSFEALITYINSLEARIALLEA